MLIFSIGEVMDNRFTGVSLVGVAMEIWEERWIDDYWVTVNTLNERPSCGTYPRRSDILIAVRVWWEHGGGTGTDVNVTHSSTRGNFNKCFRWSSTSRISPFSWGLGSVLTHRWVFLAICSVAVFILKAEFAFCSSPQLGSELIARISLCHVDGNWGNEEKDPSK